VRRSETKRQEWTLCSNSAESAPKKEAEGEIERPPERGGESVVAENGKHKLLEHEFEDLLLDVLDQDYDLAVRRRADSLERRRRDLATLSFSYRWLGPREARAVVRVEGAQDFKAILPIDASSPEELRRSAEDCESLVLFLAEHLEAKRDATMAAAASGQLRWGRREDD